MAAFDRLESFEPVSLEDLDERASLQRRVDQKYIVTLDQLADLLDELEPDHDALEIDGQRTFQYRSVYFDTPDLRCFLDHIRDVRPRFKLRTRHYVSSDKCAFEVKVKREDGETVKRSTDHAGSAAERLTEGSHGLIDETLADEGIEVPPKLESSLVTQFQRSTLGLRVGAERVTIDRELRLTCGKHALVLRDDHALLETKTEDGKGHCYQALTDAGVEPVSFSKYRLGVGRLASAHDDPGYADPLMPFFRPTALSPAAAAPSAG